MILENILNVAESMGFEKEEIVIKVQNKYENLIKMGEVRQLEELYNLTGISPEFSEEAVQEGYAACVKDVMKFRNISWIKDKTNIDISENLIQNIYEIFLKEDRFHNLEELIRVTGAHPKESLIQEFYKKYIDEEKEDALSNLQKITEIPFSEDMIQDRYSDYVKKGRLYSLENLEETTKIKPSLSQEAVQEGYDKFTRWGAMDQIEKLQKRTGVKPSFSEEAVQEGYAYLIERGFEEIKNKINIRELKEVTGISPSEDMVQKFYSDYFANRKIEEIIAIERETRVKPNLPNNLIQEHYIDYAQYGMFGTLGRLEKATGIKMSEEAIQECYANCVKIGGLEGIKTLQKRTGVKPSEEIYREIIINLQ